MRPPSIPVLIAGLILLLPAPQSAQAQNPAHRPGGTETPAVDEIDAVAGFLENLEKQTTVDGLLDIGRRYLLDPPTARVQEGLSHSSLDQVATEAVQILGQIVVDRASAQAFTVLKRKLTESLDCLGKEVDRKVRFAETCAVLESLRLQDIASSPPAFYHAVATDGVTCLLERIATTDPLLQAGITAILIEGLRRSRMTPGQESAELLVSEILMQVFAEKGRELTTGKKALVIGATAFLACRAKQYDRNPVTLGECPVNDIVNVLSNGTLGSRDPRDEIRIGAKSLAGELMVASSRMKDNLPDAQERFKNAARALFTAVCMNAGSPLGCGAKNPSPGLVDLALAQALVVGAVGGDAQAVILVLQRVIEDELEKYRVLDSRALRFIAGLLDYAATYADEAGARDAHERRTKVLESLTREMTDRTGRQGDTIVSFGGSLRVTGGARFRGGEQTLFGPLGLPLGFGLQSYRPDGGAGWHLELGILDLGQYVAFQKGGEVQEPKLADALAPSLSVGRFWGQELPWFVAVTGGYSPHYQFESGTSRRGAWFAGVAFGIYVPLFDLN